MQRHPTPWRDNEDAVACPALASTPPHTLLSSSAHYASPPAATVTSHSLNLHCPLFYTLANGTSHTEAGIPFSSLLTQGAANGFTSASERAIMNPMNQEGSKPSPAAMPSPARLPLSQQPPVKQLDAFLAAALAANNPPPQTTVETCIPPPLLQSMLASQPQPANSIAATLAILRPMGEAATVAGSAPLASTTALTNTGANNALLTLRAETGTAALHSAQDQPALSQLAPALFSSVNNLAANLAAAVVAAQQHSPQPPAANAQQLQSLFSATTTAAAASSVGVAHQLAAVSAQGGLIDLAHSSPPTSAQQLHADSAAHQSAFQLVAASLQQQQQQQPSPRQQQQQMALAQAVAASPQNFYSSAELMEGLPAALFRSLSQQTVRSPGGAQLAQQFKPIPNNERVDLLRFRLKEPQEWGADDVVAWILAVARTYAIPCENLNMHKFARCTGQLLTLMNEQAFKECDPCYGALLYSEFRKLVTDDNFLDDWIRSNNNAAPGAPAGVDDHAGLLASAAANRRASFIASRLPALGSRVIPQPPQAQQPQASPQQQPNINGILAAAATAAVIGQQQQQQEQSLRNQEMLLNAVAAQQHQQIHQQHQRQMSQLNQQRLQQQLEHIQYQQQQMAVARQRLQLEPSGSQQMVAMDMGGAFRPSTSAAGSRVLMGVDESGASSSGDAAFRGALRTKVRKNKDGRPRKRSQHTKGNKLWEFIRDCLKRPETCPAIVRWEDPVEGVFRIVESEKLARLWGERKRNQKMTYEKLSRAMRTYYDKGILVPVPKTGLYPKKLVYQFGPGAHGWNATPPPPVVAMPTRLLPPLESLPPFPGVSMER